MLFENQSLRNDYAFMLENRPQSGFGVDFDGFVFLLEAVDLDFAILYGEGE